MNYKIILCITIGVLTSCATQRKTTTNHNIIEKDTTHINQVAILHSHDTLWLTRIEANNSEKQEISTEIRQNAPQKSSFTTKIIAIETIIIVIILLIYLAKKQIKR